MTACIPIVSAALGPDPADIRIDYFELFGDRAVLRLGDNLGIATADTSPEALRRLSEAALELADWHEKKDAAAREQVAS